MDTSFFHFVRVRKETAVLTAAEKLWHQFFVKLHPSLAMLDLKANWNTRKHLASWASAARSSGENCRLYHGERLTTPHQGSPALKYCSKEKVRGMVCIGLIQRSPTLRGMHFAPTATWRHQGEAGLLLPRWRMTTVGCVPIEMGACAEGPRPTPWLQTCSTISINGIGWTCLSRATQTPESIWTTQSFGCSSLLADSPFGSPSWARETIGRQRRTRTRHLTRAKRTRCS